MPRIIGVDIPGNKRVEFSLRYLYGIGPALALEIIEKVGIDRNIKAKDLTPDQIAKITKILQDDLTVEGDLRRQLSADIRRLQQINCYRGVRHRRNLPAAHQDQCTYPQGQEDHDRRHPRQNPASSGRQGLMPSGIRRRRESLPGMRMTRLF